MEDHRSTPLEILQKAVKNTMDAFPGKKYITTGPKGEVYEEKTVAPILDTDPTKVKREEETFQKLQQEEPPVQTTVNDEIPTTRGEPVQK